VTVNRNSSPLTARQSGRVSVPPPIVKSDAVGVFLPLSPAALENIDSTSAHNFLKLIYHDTTRNRRWNRVFCSVNVFQNIT